MKRLWFAAVLLILLTTSCILVSCSIERLVGHTLALIQEAEDLGRQDDLAAAKDLCRQASGHWKHHSKTASAFLRHDETDAVEISLSRLQVFADTADKDDFLALCVELRQELQHIRDMEKPLLQNIL